MLDALNAVAHRYGGSLPSEYVSALTSFDAVAAEYKLTDDEQTDIEHWDFPRDPERLAELNDQIRAASTKWGEEYEPWPETRFVIGENGTGDLFCIDTSGVHPGVACWNHELGEPVYYDSEAEDQLGYAFASPLIYLREVCELAAQQRAG